MQQASQLQSVSDLYGADEIDFLLDEIRDFEPACCQIEDILVSPEVSTLLLTRLKDSRWRFLIACRTLRAAEPETFPYPM